MKEEQDEEEYVRERESTVTQLLEYRNSLAKINGWNLEIDSEESSHSHASVKIISSTVAMAQAKTNEIASLRSQMNELVEQIKLSRISRDSFQIKSSVIVQQL